MPDRSWKAFERRLATALGTHRIPVTGERHGAAFRDASFWYQAKLGCRFPGYLREWLHGIVAAAAMTSRIGVVIWKPKGIADAEAIVVLRFADWVALVNAGTATPGAPRVSGFLWPTSAAMARQRLATLRGAQICARAGCGQPLPATLRRHGSPRRFCSARCRWLAWRAAHPEKAGAAA